MKNINYYFFNCFIFFALIFFASCREEIVSPNNPAGNVNEPVQYHSNTSYTFIINADDISKSVNNFPSFNTTNIRLYTSVLDITSGSVQVFLLDSYNHAWYSRTFASETKNSAIDFSGNFANLIQIKMSHFTGKLKVQLISLR